MDQLVAIEESELLIPAGSSVLTTLIISLPQEEWEGISLEAFVLLKKESAE